MSRIQMPWPFVRDQGWRWRHPRLWRGRPFDPDNPRQVLSYAVLRLGRDRRDVFLLSQIKALDYALIARQLGISVAEVQAHLAGALYEIVRTMNVIERARPRSIPLSNVEPADVSGR